MITKSLLINHHYRNEVIHHIVEKDYKSVLDVGGAMGAWPNATAQHFYKRDVLTAYMDYNAKSSIGVSLDTGALLFGGNMSNYWEWAEILEHVQSHGKFEFCICTQTLEDIRDPVTVLHMLPKVAERGYIDIPSKYLELTKGCEGNTLDPKTDIPDWGIHSPIYGFTGHRWIMNMIDNVLWVLPKLPFIEVIEDLEQYGPQLSDGFAEKPTMPDSNGFLAFWWEGDEIPCKVVGDDFLGPNPPAVYNMYRECLRKGL